MNRTGFVKAGVALLQERYGSHPTAAAHEFADGMMEALAPLCRREDEIRADVITEVVTALANEGSLAGCRAADFIERKFGSSAKLG